MKALTAFFGDGEHQFKLTTPLIVELESKCGAGIGTIAARVFARQFSQCDIVETIRLAAIGAGMPPKRAAEMVAAYVADQPLIASWPLASRILEHVWFGEPHREALDKA
ncbi:gene transfer agent family protein [Bradyrhizobium sp. AZCC 1699]|uniref:gene transfer agent family protein n=1 Tax=Bradyrhizobium sp. AZCC 1699 TaxID=3117024 RepID=UPI002FEFE5AA